MSHAKHLGVLYILGTILLPLGLGLRFGVADGIIALGSVLLGHFLLQTYILNRRPPETET